MNGQSKILTVSYVIPGVTRIENVSVTICLTGCLGINFFFLSLKGACRMEKLMGLEIWICLVLSQCL